MSVYFGARHGVGIFRSNRPSLQLARSTLLFLSSILWIIGVSQVPLTTASAVSFTAPIFVVLMSIPLLGEKVGRHRWFAVFLGFVGALVVVRPTPEGIEPAMLYLLGAATMFALYQILTRKLAQSDPAGTTAVYTCLLYTSPSPRDATLSRMPSSA